jgi:hypothetical protein
MSASAVLDVNGNGTVSLGPSSPGEVWVPESVAISCTGTQPTVVSTVVLYAGNGISPQYQVDNSYDVLGASSSMIAGRRIHAGQEVSAVWNSGPAGGTATLAVYGTRQVP